MKYFVYIIILIVTVAIVAGFFIVGSPTEERARRFDNQRVSDLQNIQLQIINYWQSKGRLPEKLSDLTDSISGFVAPRDPETATDYVYTKTGDINFKLCANFNLSNSQSASNSKIPEPVAPQGITYQQAYPQSAWNHSAGQICFDRSIDKDLYPVKPKPPVL